ncbi:MAG: HupE/UreJ family protein [Sulfurimonas sp.]|jgi:urease accessory protein
MKILLVLLSLSVFVFGHTTTLESGGFGDGYLHPLSGLDHILVMIGVGMVAFFVAKKSYLILFAFMGAMVVSAIMGYLGIKFLFVEEGILVSIAVIFALIGFVNKISIHIIVSIVAFFGMFHGFAHGAEFQGGGFVHYIAGFTLSTLMFHLLGMALAYGYSKSVLNKQTQIVNR